MNKSQCPTNFSCESKREVAQSCPTLCDPMDCNPPGSSVYGIFRQKCWRDLTSPSPGDLPDPGIEPGSPALRADALPLSHQGSSIIPWTARRSNQSILKEISPEYSLEGLMLKLKFQYFGHLLQRADSLEKILILEKIEGRSRRGWKRKTWLDGITDSMDMSLSKH